MKKIVSTLLLALAVAFSTAVLAEPVDINTADAETLAAGLNGVGLSKAEAIVAYRKANGPFTSAEDLTQVKGIGPALVDKNRDNIRVASSAGTQ